MRIHRIEIEGFGPFRERQAIDLDRYAADGIFLIGGRTGAGKSSILDAICFALYGSVPRYEDGDKRLRSDHAQPEDPTEVAVEFTAGARTWRIERSPEFFRPKKRGDGVTPQKAEARMFERVDGEWVGRAARPVDVAQLVDEVIGLTQQQFLQVILLAQGRFARFLLAKNDERQALLRTLFGTKRFEDYTQALEERRKEAVAQVESRGAALEAQLADAERIASDLFDADDDADELEPRIARLGSAALRARHLAESADAAERTAADALDAAERAHAERTAQRDKQERRDAARRALAELEERADQIAALRAERDAAVRAEPVRAAREAAERARDAVTTAAARREEARSAWEDVAESAVGAGESAGLGAGAAADAGVGADARATPDAAVVTDGGGEGAPASAALDATADVATASGEGTGAGADDPVTRDTIAALDARAGEGAGAPDTLDAIADAGAGAGNGGEVSAPLDGVAGLDAAAGVDAAAGDETDAPEVLDGIVAAGQQRIGAWRPLAEVEARIEEDAAALGVLRDEARAVAERAEGLEERARALPAEQQRVRDALDEATALAATVDALRTSVQSLEGRLAAARAVPTLAAAQQEALAALQRAKSAKDDAEAHLAELQRRRFAGMAGELAAELADGEPCAVCGSTSHPAPAARGDDAVSADDIEAADADRRVATDAYEAANARLGEADRAHAEAVRDAAGASEADLDGELTSARDRLREAEEAADRRIALTAERDALDTEAADHGARREALIAERTQLDERIAAAARALARDRVAVAAARGPAPSIAARIDDEERRVARAADYAEAQRESARAEERAAEADDLLRTAAEEAGFGSVPEALAALRDARERERLDALVREHEDALTRTKAALMDLELEVLPDEPVDVAASLDAVTAAKEAWSAAVKGHTEAAQRARALEEAAERITAAHAAIAELAAEAAAIRRLADTVAGRAPNARRMKLETFVLAAELEEIVAAANVRLAEMSGDRYRLQHSDALAARGAASGLGLEVMDRFTGRARPPHSLSGGETFLASLALALGLAEVVTNRAGGIRLDTLFIDEGFGSLDAETLDVAMRTLDELRQGGRTVGIISHVEAMKEQIPAQLRVERTPQGWSVVRQEPEPSRAATLAA